MRIGILGHYGDFNLGDEAAIEAVVRNIQITSPESKICCISVRPDDSRARHEVDAFPVQRQFRSQQARLDPSNGRRSPSATTFPTQARIRERLKRFYPLVLIVRSIRAIGRTMKTIVAEAGFLMTCYRKLAELDLVLIAGSNQCFDFVDGPWHFPYNLLKWSALTRLRGRKLAFVCVGAGPIRSPLSRWMIRQALAFAHYRSFRDESSKSLILSIGAGDTDDPVLPDLAFSLPVQLEAPTHSAEHGSGKFVIGFNPMPLFDDRYWPDFDREKYRRLIGKYAELVAHLQHEGHEILFYSTHPRDESVIDDIIGQLGNEVAGTERVRARTVSELLASLKRIDVAVATRFHGILLAYLMGKPSLGIEYWKKTGDLMRQMRQERYLLPESQFVGAETVDFDSVCKKLNQLLANLSSEKCCLSSLLSSNKRALDKQYSTLLMNQLPSQN